MDRLPSSLLKDLICAVLCANGGSCYRTNHGEEEDEINRKNAR